SPDAVATASDPSVPRTVTSADFVRTSSADPCGQRMRHSMPPRPKMVVIPKLRFCGTSIRSVGRAPCVESSTRAASTSRSDSSSWAISSTVALPSADASTSMPPAASRTSRSIGPCTSNDCCMVFLLRLARGVAGQPPAAGLDGARLGRACDRAYEPRVDRDAFTLGGTLDGGLERLREAQADPRRELFAAARSGAVGPAVDVHELGLLPRQPNLDVARGELCRNLDCRLGEQVEELQAEVRPERLGQALGDADRPLVAELGDALQVLLEPLEHDRQIHDDITMTSWMASVKCHRDDRLLSPRSGR